MHTTARTTIPYAYHKAEAARLRRQAMADLFGRLGRLWHRPVRPRYSAGSGLAAGQ